MKKLFFYILIIIQSLVNTTIGFCQCQQTNGPFGGNISCFASDGNKVFAGTECGGIYLSLNNGIYWESKSKGLSRRTDEISSDENPRYSQQNGSLEQSLKFYPSINAIIIKDSLVYAGTEAGLFRSKDEGNSWEHISGMVFGHECVYSLARNDNYMFIGMKDGIYRANIDGKMHIKKGEEERSIEIGKDIISANKLSDIKNIQSIAVKDNYVVFGNDQDILFSSDNGQTWTDIRFGLPYEPLNGRYFKIKTLTIIDTNIYAGIEGDQYSQFGVYKTSVYRIKWSLDKNNFKTLVINSIISLNKTVIAGSDNGVFLSMDDCKSWSEMNEGLPKNNDFFPYNKLSDKVITINTLLFTGKDVLAGTQQGVFILNFNDLIWKLSNDGIKNNDIRSFGKIGNSILAGTVDGSLFISDDVGNNWIKFNSYVPGYNPVTTIASIEKNVLIGTKNKGILTISNGNQKLLSLNDGLTKSFSIFINKIVKKDNTVYAATGAGLFLSTDNGKHWIIAENKYNTRAINTLTTKENKVYVLNDSEIFQVSEDGTIWNLMSKNYEFTKASSIEIIGANIFVGTGLRGVLMSKNNGKSWERKNNGLPYIKNEQNNYKEICIRALVTKDGNIYVATDSGIYETRDMGENWKLFNINLQTLRINSLFIDGTYLYAGTECEGIWKCLLQ